VEPANGGETEVLIIYTEAVKSYKTLVLLFEVVFCVFLEAWSLLEAVKSYKNPFFFYLFEEVFWVARLRLFLHLR
jgi:hypothetical protein